MKNKDELMIPVVMLAFFSLLAIWCSVRTGPTLGSSHPVEVILEDASLIQSPAQTSSAGPVWRASGLVEAPVFGQQELIPIASAAEPDDPANLISEEDVEDAETVPVEPHDILVVRN